MLIKLLIIYVSLCSVHLREFKYNSYNDIISRFSDLKEKYPEFLQIDSSQHRYNLDAPMCGDSPCITQIVFLTNFNSFSFNKPTIYFSGLLHGNERLGPNILIELTEFMLENRGKYPWINHLLDSRLIVITPMTNAYGYYNNVREEAITKNIYFPDTSDPNRDFPYFSYYGETAQCMKTIAARTVNELFREFLFLLSFTYHGGINVIGYPWGNNIHINGNAATEAPDFTAIHDIGKTLLDISTSEKNIQNGIESYILGDMTSTVYPLDGAMEDWAYAGTWENSVTANKPVKLCNASTFNGYDVNKTNYSFNPIKNIIYLIETDKLKAPREKDFGNSEDILDDNFFGHINRNIRMSLALMDYGEPYILIECAKEKDDFLFKFMGCKTVDEVKVHLLTKRNGENKIIRTSTIKQNFKCYLSDGKSVYHLKDILKELNENEFIMLEAKFDSEWKFQQNPDPFVKPQSFLVNLRLNETYFEENDNYYVSGKTFQSDYILKKNDALIVIKKRSIHNFLSKSKIDFFIDSQIITFTQNDNKFSLESATVPIEKLNGNIIFKKDLINLVERNPLNSNDYIINCKKGVCEVPDSDFFSLKSNFLGNKVKLVLDDYTNALSYFTESSILDNENQIYNLMWRNSICGEINPSNSTSMYSDLFINFVKISNLNWKINVEVNSDSLKYTEISFNIPYQNSSLKFTFEEINNKVVKIVKIYNLNLIGKNLQILIKNESGEIKRQCTMFQKNFESLNLIGKTVKLENLKKDNYYLFLYLAIALIVIIIALFLIKKLVDYLKNGQKYDSRFAVPSVGYQIGSEEI